MDRALLLSVTPNPRRGLLRWLTFLDLGHVDITLSDPPNPPETYGFYVSPTSHLRVFLSLLWPQPARMVRARAPLRGPALTWTYPLAGDRFAAVASYLRQVSAGCVAGTTRYRAVRFNCFHLARRCLEIAGVEPGRLPRQWVVVVPTLGFRSFARGLPQPAPASPCSAAKRR